LCITYSGPGRQTWEMSHLPNYPNWVGVDWMDWSVMPGDDVVFGRLQDIINELDQFRA
jgi:hypothetical protein